MATCKTTTGGYSEGWGPVSPSRSFDLTPCFEEGIVLSTFLVALLIASCVGTWNLRSLSALPLTRRSGHVLKAKLTLVGLAVAASLANIGIVVFTRTPVALLRFYILEPLALFASLFLLFTNHTRTRTSSSVILFFWPLYTVGLLIWARTLFLTRPPTFLVCLALRCAVASLGLASFALELGAPKFEYLEEEERALAKGHVPDPLLNANVFSRWTFMYMTPLLKKGASKVITDDDLPCLPEGDQAMPLAQRLQNSMAKYKSLYTALCVAYGGPYAVAAFLKFLSDCFSFLQPQLLRWLLYFFSNYQDAREGFVIGGPSPYEGLSVAVLMFVSSIIQTILLHQYFQRCFETGMRVRAGVVTVIYQKALRLSNDGQGQSTGEVVSLMSVDATRLQDFCTYGLIMVSGVFQIVLAFVSLYDLLGWSAFVGVAVMIFSIPLNTVIARILKNMQTEQMKAKDRRTKLMSELLNNIRSIKLYAWDYAFMSRVFRVRNDEELKNLRKISLWTSLSNALWSGIPLLVAFSSFATAAVISSQPLTADIVFPAISLFMLLQFPLAMIAQVTSNLVEAIVSVRRLSKFFDADELQVDARNIIIRNDLEEGDEVLSIVDGEFSWSQTVQTPILENINVTVKKGELLAVLGRVGAGKTSLLAAIVGDMKRLDGKVTVYGSVAYAPQNPWIMSGTIRENIIFHHQYDDTFYNLLLDACALRPDLALLPEGDQTEIGEKGITLSGGQRARVALARAVYARADLVLLDDVLSAVDAEVARHIFDHVIGPSGLLATKARILVTNSISFLSNCSNIVLIRNGIILESGDLESIMNRDKGEIRRLVRDHAGGHASSGSSTPFITGGSSTPLTDDKTLAEHSSERLEKVSDQLKRRTSFVRATMTDPAQGRMVGSDGLKKEHSETGRVKSSVYLRYLEASSKSGFALFLLATIVGQVFSVLASFALRSWSENNRVTRANDGISRYLAVYGIFSLSSVLFMAIASTVLLLLCSLRSSKHLHDSMLNSLMHAPLSFFETTPSGRILNVFSRDIYAIDQVLARVIQGVFRTAATCVGIVVVVAIVFPIFLVVIPPLAFFYQRVVTYYLTTSRELKRLNAVSRSPIFSWFSESLNGLSTIRAFEQQSTFIAGHRQRVDANLISYLPGVSINRWLAIRLEFVGACIIFVVSMLSLATLVTSGVDAALVGLVLSYALNITGSLNWVVRSASEVEQNIVSVERVLHYVELTPEAPYEIPETHPEDWPAAGAIQFQNYSTRYRPELDLVLKKIDISIGAGEKIGCSGRTGSGKSSLLLALFRILEAAEGVIFIDGIDISTIGLHDLRSAISIVPQSPDLFEGTLRENIDPVGTYQDVDIWTVLGQVHLKEFVEGLPGGLDAAVKEGGSSLSSGQRQLLCFARALLRRTKILVLDEATSAVDLDTDKSIQEIIRSPVFADITILTIAHRLNTIMDSDRILVMDAGEVVEFDHPKALLEQKNSKFYSLAMEAGLV